jgi:hypothetical protein
VAAAATAGGRQSRVLWFCHGLDMEQEAGAAIAMAALEMASSGDRGRLLVAFRSAKQTISLCS